MLRARQAQACHGLLSSSRCKVLSPAASPRRIRVGRVILGAPGGHARAAHRGRGALRTRVVRAERADRRRDGGVGFHPPLRRRHRF